jgi:hypothetical protein
VGDTAEATARELEETRRQMEAKVAKLAERAPQELRKLARRAAVVAVSLVALLLVVKALGRLRSRGGDDDD